MITDPDVRHQWEEPRRLQEMRQDRELAAVAALTGQGQCLKKARPGMKNGKKYLLCPVCNRVLAQVLHGDKGYQAYLDSYISGMSNGHGTATIYWDGSIGGGGHAPEWRYCLVMPSQFSAIGQVKVTSPRKGGTSAARVRIRRYGLCSGKDWTELQQVKTAEQIQQGVARRMAKRAAEDIQEYLATLPSDRPPAEVWICNPVSTRRTTALMDELWQSYEELLRTNPSDYKALANLSLRIEIEAFKQRQRERVELEAPKLRTTILEPDLPILVACPECRKQNKQSSAGHEEDVILLGSTIDRTSW